MERFKQRVPRAIWQRTALLGSRKPTDPNQPTRTQPNRKCIAKSKTRLKPKSDSAISQHLLESNQCARNYSDLRFKILTTAHSITSLKPVGSGLYFTEKNRFEQSKAVRTYSSTVSIRLEPAVTRYITFLRSAFGL